MAHPEAKQMIPANNNLGSMSPGNLMINPIQIITIPNNSNPFAA